MTGNDVPRINFTVLTAGPSREILDAINASLERALKANRSSIAVVDYDGVTEIGAVDVQAGTHAANGRITMTIDDFDDPDAVFCVELTRQAAKRLAAEILALVA